MKMRKIQEFLNLDLTGEKLDTLMKEMLEEKFDSELKDKYSQTLETKYNLARTDSKQQGQSSLRSKLIFLFIFIALLIAGYIGMQTLNQTSDVQQYLAENQMKHFGATRTDNAELTKNKLLAYQAFNADNFDRYKTLIQSEKNLTQEDQFFQAYVLMREEKYQEARTIFQELRTSLKPDQQYYEEANLYHAICFLKTDADNFQELYNGLEKDSWVKKELDKILE